MQITLTREDNTERMKKRMHEEIEAQCAAVYRQKITDLEEGLQRSEQKVTELAMKNKQIAQDLDRLVILPDCTLFKNIMILLYSIIIYTVQVAIINIYSYIQGLVLQAMRAQVCNGRYA